jgi:hypothetical protein
MNQRKSQLSIFAGALMFLSFSASITQAAHAQQSQPYDGVMTRTPAKQNPQFYTEDLKSTPDLPYVPNYTGRGALLTSGLFYPKLQNGKCYHLRWQAKEDGRTVLNWYKNVLESNGWTIVTAQTNDRTLAATRDKEGLTVFLTLQPPSYSGYQCGFLLRYLEVAPKIAGR